MDEGPLACDELMVILKGALRRRLKEKGNGIFISSHEALGSVTEEYNELVDAVTKNDPVNFMEECLDVAVAAFFSYVSMRHIERLNNDK